MIELLKPVQYELARPVFASLDNHLAIYSVLAGEMEGRVWVDNPANPGCALLQNGDRFHLAGEACSETFEAGLRQVFNEVIYPEGRAQGREAFSLFYAPDHWAVRIEKILAGKDPLTSPRQYYEYQAFPGDWRDILKPGWMVRSVDSALLAETGLGNLDNLRQEMISEIPTVEEFLQRRFGVALQVGQELAGWCLSEYNLGDRCEVGIETMPAYRRQGVATLLAGAMAEMAQRQGFRRIGWHCYADNLPSIATALRAGYTKKMDYPWYFALFDEAANLAVNGNFRLYQGEYGQALEWYARSIASGKAPAWAYVQAAAAYSLCGQAQPGLAHLRLGLERGFDDLAYLTEHPRFAFLRAQPEWPEFWRWAASRAEQQRG